MEAVALSDALILVLKEGKPVDPVLTMYSDERRQVFQFFIDPVSSWVSSSTFLPRQICRSGLTGVVCRANFEYRQASMMTGSSAA